MKDEKPLLVDTGRGFTIQWKGRYLASSYQPKKQAQRWAQSLNLKGQTCYILFRPLFGYGLEILLQKLPDDSRILCLETNQDLFALCSAVFFQEHGESPVHRYVRTQWGPNLDSIINDWGIWNFRRCEILSPLGAWQDDDLPLIKDYLQGMITRYWKNRMTQIRLGRRWILNIFRNLAHFETCQSFPQLKKPVLLLGAGPSLDSLLEDWPSIQMDFFLLAVDTALPALTARGIHPHGVINLDGQYYNALDYYQQPRDMIHFSDITAWPSTLREGKHFFFLSHFAEMPFLNELAHGWSLPLIPPMGSVGVLALGIAKGLTRNAIVIAGLDFAFPPGKNHCRGSISHEWLINHQSRTTGITLGMAQSYRGELSHAGHQGWKTNSQLQGYPGDLLGLRKEDSRGIWQYRGGGLDLGLPLWDPSVKIQSEIYRGEEASSWIQCSPRLGWLESKGKELIEMLKVWDNYAREEGDVTPVLEALEPLEYLYGHLPFHPPKPTESPRVLLPIMQDARRLLRIMEKG